MNFFGKLRTILKYAPYAVVGAQEVESTLGGGGGATKRQILVTAILGAAHAGEATPNEKVQQIAATVDLTVAALNALGLLGKTPAAVAVVPQV